MKKLIVSVLAAAICAITVFSTVVFAANTTNGTYYSVNETNDAGLELRTGPGTNYSSYGPIPVNGTVLVESFSGQWALCSYGGKKGWANTSYLYEYYLPVSVYDTGSEGLALKEAPDINSKRYLLIPENTRLEIRKVQGAWGYVYYNGYSGWVALRYTKAILGTLVNMAAVAPTNGFITPKTYRVVNAPDGLELRLNSDGENTTWGPIPNGTSLTIYAIENNWGFTVYNQCYGWVLMTYLQ